MYYFKTGFKIIAVLFLLIGCKNPEKEKIVKTENTLSFIKTSGKRLIDNQGNTLLLKGTNIGNWLVPEGYMFKMNQVNAPRKIDELLYELIGPDSLNVFWDQFLNNYITHEDIKYLKQIGCNHIRLPFHYKLFTQDLYMGKRNAGFTYFDRIIDWCRQEKLYVLLDMHCAPGGQTGDNIDDSYGYPYLLKSQSSKDLMTSIWVDIAKKYKEEPVVLGYDLINEPVAHYFQDEIETLNHELLSLYKQTISAIRMVDKTHTIYLNGSIWSGNFDVFKEIIDNNVVYEFHKYWFDVNQSAVQTYVDFSNQHQVPIYLGESGENTDQWIYDFRNLLDANNINWCFWPYKKMNSPSSIMNFEEPEDYHLISEYSLSDRSTYQKIRDHKPSQLKVQKALNNFIENSLFKNSYPNTGYIKALKFTIE